MRKHPQVQKPKRTATAKPVADARQGENDARSAASVSPWRRVALAGVLAAAAAWCAGRYWSGERPPVAAAAVSAASSKTAARPRSEILSVAEELRRMPESIGRRQRVLTLVDRLTPADFPQALAALEGDDSGTLALAGRWAEEDPAGFFQHIKSMPDSTLRTFPLTRTLFAAWAQKDPAAALAAAKANHFRPAFSNAAILTIEAVMMQDLDKGVAMLKEFPVLPNAHTFPEALWKLDPASLVRAVVGHGIVPDKNLSIALRGPVTAWAQKEPKAVRQWMEALPVETLRGVLAGAMDGLAADDPAAAAALVLKLPSAADREAASVNLVRSWVLRDAGAAYQFAASQLGANRRYAMENMAMSLIGQGPQAVAAASAVLPEGAVRTEALTAIAWRWLDEDPDSAARWIAQLPAGQSRADAVTAVASRWAESSPETGRQYLLANAADAATDEAFRLFTARHAPYHPEECLQFVLQMPAERQEEGTRIAFNALAMDYQLDEAAALLQKLPAALQVEAVRSVVMPSASGFTQVEAVSQWAAKLPPGPLRDTARDLFQNTPGMEPENRAKALDALK